VIWFLSSFGFGPDGFGMVDMDTSILAAIGRAIAWIFTPLGWADWKSAVAAVTGLVAKENVVGTFGILFHYDGAEELAEAGDQIWNLVRANYSGAAAGYSFLAFNLLCAPCFAAIGAIRREMNNGKWTLRAIGWECGLAYCVGLVVFQLAGLVTGETTFNVFTIVAIALVALGIWGLVRPYHEATELSSSLNAAVEKDFARKTA
jgi:ferrous iron transport protein B